MKKKKLSNLKLNRTLVSNLNNLKGGNGEDTWVECSAFASCISHTCPPPPPPFKTATYCGIPCLEPTDGTC